MSNDTTPNYPEIDKIANLFTQFKTSKNVVNMNDILKRIRILHGMMCLSKQKKMNDIVKLSNGEEIKTMCFDISMYDSLIDTVRKLINQCEHYLERDLVDMKQSGGGMKDTPHLINFYSDTCSACSFFEPIWKDVESLSNKVGLSSQSIECGEDLGIQQKYNIAEFPTIRLYSGTQMNQYSGPHSLQSIGEWIKELTEINIIP